jgi:hypothetical protein
MMDTLMMTSSEMLLNRFGLCFNYIFLGMKLSPKIKLLMHRIDIGEEERKDRGEAEAGEERKDTIMCFVITSVERGLERGCAAIPFYLSALILPKYLMPGVKGVGLEPMMLSYA